MVAHGDLPDGEAAKTMAVIVRVARENAPNTDPAGLRMRLIHTARDARHNTELALIRQQREQQKQLADVATEVLRRGGSEADAGRAMLAAVRTMTPTPPVEIGEAALNLARWRIRNGR
jgi:hypothetical protein